MYKRQDYDKHRGRYTYHIHLVMEFKSETAQEFLHYRIIMSNDGIIRIETIDALAESPDSQIQGTSD